MRANAQEYPGKSERGWRLFRKRSSLLVENRSFGATSKPPTALRVEPGSWKSHEHYPHMSACCTRSFRQIGQDLRVALSYVRCWESDFFQFFPFLTTKSSRYVRNEFRNGFYAKICMKYVLFSICLLSKIIENWRFRQTQNKVPIPFFGSGHFLTIFSKNDGSKNDPSQNSC